VPFSAALGPIDNTPPNMAKGALSTCRICLCFSLEDVYRAIKTLKEEGVENFSIDLMGGLPNQVGLPHY